MSGFVVVVLGFGGLGFETQSQYTGIYYVVQTCLASASAWD